MNFATERLTAEKLAPAHLGELTTLHLDPEACRYLGGVRTPESTSAYLDVNLAHWAEHGYGLWVVRMSDGAFAGRVGIRHTLLEGAPEVEIAYTFKPELWGRGLATEAADALVRLWRARLDVPSLVGIASIENYASRRVLAKAGFKYEREATYHDEPVVVYRLVR